VTLSKALGAAGAAVCASSSVRQLLLQRGRPLIYSTALPHPVVAAARTAVHLLAEESERVDCLREKSRLLHALLDGVAAPARDHDLPIVPVLLGDATRTMAAEQTLWERGWMVHGLRPPTVPSGTSRLRLMVSTEHTEEDMRGVAAAVRDLAV